MLDEQTVDVGIVIGSLISEILTEIDAIGANQHGQLHNGNVMLQIELRFLAILFQQWSDIIANG